MQVEGYCVLYVVFGDVQVCGMDGGVKMLRMRYTVLFLHNFCGAVGFLFGGFLRKFKQLNELSLAGINM